MSDENENLEDLPLLDCIGVDRLLHRCVPWKDVTLCGVQVIQKNVSPQDLVLHYSCYRCTY
jgi:hypothetical protein